MTGRGRWPEGPGPRGGRSRTPPAGGAAAAGERRRRLSQNFFAAAQDAAAFAGQLTVEPSAPVVELGAGSGQITRVLAGAGHPVTALEIDDSWAERVRRLRLPGVEVLVTDVLTWRPEQSPVTLIGNLPFGLGTQILRHVLELGPASLGEGVFLLQHEYVGKRVGRWGGTLFNAQWGPWFGFAEGLRFGRTAFRPVPRTDAATLVVRPHLRSAVAWTDRTAYQEMAEALFGTGHAVLGDAARSTLGRSASGTLARARLDPHLLVKNLDVAAWAALFAARPGSVHRREGPDRGPSPGRAGRPGGHRTGHRAGNRGVG